MYVVLSSLIMWYCCFESLDNRHDVLYGVLHGESLGDGVFHGFRSMNWKYDDRVDNDDALNVWVWNEVNGEIHCVACDVVVNVDGNYESVYVLVNEPVDGSVAHHVVGHHVVLQTEVMECA